ncbi:hypothetical protein DY000_02021726 [Brassica cretica]|uniref:Uncharacterized protein n=1 Tax=Brassica cretica TaxID=69181 RepID=A0ABQ7E4K3_BRACR|nr:hypothetical protein DY000_02021726 [Brassica cretica]
MIVTMIKLLMEMVDGVAYNNIDEIHFNKGYLVDLSKDARREFSGVVYHEVVHSLLSNGMGQAPVCIIKRIADYVRLKADHAPDHWVGSGGGDKWDKGYDVTARFLEYCNELMDVFVVELHKKMNDGYSENIKNSFMRGVAPRKRGVVDVVVALSKYVEAE